MPDDGLFDDLPTGDEVDVPVDVATVAAVVRASGGTAEDTIAGPVVRMRPATAPPPPLTLRLGDVDLGRWRLLNIVVKTRHSGARFVMTLQRVAER